MGAGLPALHPRAFVGAGLPALYPPRYIHCSAGKPAPTFSVRASLLILVRYIIDYRSGVIPPNLTALRVHGVTAKAPIAPLTAAVCRPPVSAGRCVGHCSPIDCGSNGSKMLGRETMVVCAGRRARAHAR